VHEYREALDLINNAKESFMGLPSDVRKMFDNDPGEFFEFATDPANAEKMVELGLAPSPDSAPPTNEESAAEAEDAEKSEA
jgi:phage internal scaffolding protein